MFSKGTPILIANFFAWKPIAQDYVRDGDLSLGMSGREASLVRIPRMTGEMEAIWCLYVIAGMPFSREAISYPTSKRERGIIYEMAISGWLRRAVRVSVSHASQVR